MLFLAELQYLSAPLPIQLALSAAVPALRGYLTDADCRWPALQASVDDRTEEERELKVKNIS